LHYATDCDHVNHFALFAVADSADRGFSNATAPAAGDWSSADDYAFIDMESDESTNPVPVTWPGEGCYRHQLVWADLAPYADTAAGSTGHLCTFTTGAAGTLYLELYMDWIDPAAYEATVMYTQAAFTVVH
jgi:hypothetical protein